MFFYDYIFLNHHKTNNVTYINTKIFMNEIYLIDGFDVEKMG